MIVFDGFAVIGQRGRARQSLLCRYALHRGADGADDRIVELVAALPEGRIVLVYTSDRRLRERVSALGAGAAGEGGHPNFCLILAHSNPRASGERIRLGLAPVCGRFGASPELGRGMLTCASRGARAKPAERSATAGRCCSRTRRSFCSTVRGSTVLASSGLMGFCNAKECLEFMR